MRGRRARGDHSSGDAVTVTIGAAVTWAARDAVLAQLERYRPLAKADARYRVTVARLEMTLAALDADLQPQE